MTKLFLPTSMRPLADGQSAIDLSGATIGELIDDLGVSYPPIKQQLLDDNGNLKSYIAIFVNESDIRSLEGPQTPVRAHDEVYIIPAIAGGR